MKFSAVAVALVVGCASKPTTPAADVDSGMIGSDAANADGNNDGWVPGEQIFESRETIDPVAPGDEGSKTVVNDLGNNDTLWAYAIEWISPKGLHHSQLEAPPAGGPVTEFRPIMSLPVALSTGVYRAPAGHAIRLDAHQPLKISYHYVNTAKTPITGEVLVRVHALPRNAPAPTPLSFFAMTNTDLNIPARSRASETMTCVLTKDVIIHDVMAHQHVLGRGVHAEVIGGAHDGLALYKSTNWEGAPVLPLLPPLTLKAGDAVRVTCDYENATDMTVRFGFSANEEMCGIAMHYSGENAIGMGRVDSRDCILFTK